MPFQVRALFAVVLLLVGAVVVVLAVEDRMQRRPGRSEAFQRLVGGLGFGPALDLSGCAFGFDPRLDGACAWQRGPIPAGTCFCPRHAGSVFFYPPPAGRTDLPRTKEADALPH
jgi:hypothetical protein